MHITIKSIPFEFVRDESGTFYLMGSDYCEDEMISFIKKNLPEKLKKVPQVVENYRSSHG